jgi:hypothetical protein
MREELQSGVVFSLISKCILISFPSAGETLDPNGRRCWSNYLGRQPQLSSSNLSVPKFEVFPEEEAEQWCPYTDYGIGQEHSQPARTRAVALQISKLCEISNDLLAFFYHPAPKEKQPSRQSELKRLSDVHTRLEAWRKSLPAEMEAKEGQLPQVLLMQ